MSTLQERTLAYASRPEAEMALFMCAFAEMLFVPVSADLMLVPMVLVNFDKAYRYALIAMSGSVLGGVVAYLLGFSIYEAMNGASVIQGTWATAFQFFQTIFADYNALLVLAAGLATIPFKGMALLSGFFSAGAAPFVMASIVSRGVHYFLIAWLLWRGGARYKEWIDRYFQGLSMVMALGMLLVFVMIMLLVKTA